MRGGLYNEGRHGYDKELFYQDKIVTQRKCSGDDVAVAHDRRNRRCTPCKALICFVVCSLPWLLGPLRFCFPSDSALSVTVYNCPRTKLTWTKPRSKGTFGNKSTHSHLFIFSFSFSDVLSHVPHIRWSPKHPWYAVALSQFVLRTGSFT